MTLTHPLHLLVMAKEPVAGRVKTRLCPPCDPAEAAAIAGAALADTLQAVAGCGADVKIVALDGRPGPWLPAGFKVIAQRGASFDQRLANAWADTRQWTDGWGIQIGMDTPQVTVEILDGLLDAMRCQPTDEPGAVLGRARDGGWWSIGLPGSDPAAVFEDVPMSTSRTGQAQHERLRSLGLRVTGAPVLTDIDTFADLIEVAAGLPGSRTAEAAHQLQILDGHNIGDVQGRSMRALGRRPGPSGPRPTGPPAGPGDQVVLRGDDGLLLPLDPSRWHGPLTVGDQRILDGIEGPVLDIGCGPGRIVAGLALQGVVALGVDPAPGAVALARARGCPVLQRSVFEPLPGEGRWESVLLFDGNLGIGGDPVRLLRRCGALARKGGAVIAEVEVRSSGWRTCRARLERAGEFSTWFHWSVVGADAVADLAERAGLVVQSLEHAEGRCFAHLSTRARAC